MSRRTGNNYSGPRWAFSSGNRNPEPRTPRPSGVSSSGGSNRPTVTIQRLALDRDCPECGWPETYAEVDLTSAEPGADAHGCSKCGWRVEAEVSP